MSGSGAADLIRNAHRMTSMRTLAVQPRERMEVRLRLEEEQSRHLSDKRESVKVGHWDSAGGASVRSGPPPPI